MRFCVTDGGPPPAGKSPRIVLIVEDEPLLRMLAAEVVEEAGFVALGPAIPAGIDLAALGAMLPIVERGQSIDSTLA